VATPVDLSSRPAHVGFPTRFGLRIRHGARIGRDLGVYAVEQRLWWLLPLVLVLMLVALAVTTAHAVVPVAVYTLF